MNRKRLMAFFILASVSASAFVFAEEMGITDQDRIQSMLDYHQKMVGMIEAYIKDRARIPSDYQAVSDKEFFRKAKAEKLVERKVTGEKPASAPKATSTQSSSNGAQKHIPQKPAPDSSSSEPKKAKSMNPMDSGR